MIALPLQSKRISVLDDGDQKYKKNLAFEELNISQLILLRFSAPSSRFATKAKSGYHLLQSGNVN